MARGIFRQSVATLPNYWRGSVVAGCAPAKSRGAAELRCPEQALFLHPSLSFGSCAGLLHSWVALESLAFLLVQEPVPPAQMWRASSVRDAQLLQGDDQQSSAVVNPNAGAIDGGPGDSCEDEAAAAFNGDGGSLGAFAVRTLKMAAKHAKALERSAPNALIYAASLGLAVLVANLCRLRTSAAPG